MTNLLSQPTSAKVENAPATSSVLIGIFADFSDELATRDGFADLAPKLAELLSGDKAPNEAEVRALLSSKS
jgi:hypothetical protein